MSTPTSKNERFPSQIRFIIGNEAAERFSYYGMTSILTIYMAKYLGFADHVATARYHYFTMGVYIAPLLGGWLADRFFGRFKIIFWVSFLYLAGHATLAAWDGPYGLLVGCTLIALGAGGIKPCVSAFVGDQFSKEKEHLLERVYGWFYFSINAGALISQWMIPELLARYGPAWAFGVPGLAMALATAVYVLGRKQYVRLPPTGRNPHGFFSVLLKSGFNLTKAETLFPMEAVNGVRAALRISLVFLPAVAFWALFNQYGSSWVLQATKMNLVVLGMKLEASQISVLNGAFVLGLIPVMNAVYGKLESSGVKVTPLRKMVAGMYITILSFVSAALLEGWIVGGATPSAAWQIPQYFFVSLGEVLVSVTALEFAYTQAPTTMKSVIMGMWFLVIAGGNLLTATVTELNQFSGAAYYWFFVGLQVVAAVIFTGVAAWYRPAVGQASPASEPARSAA